MENYIRNQNQPPSQTPITAHCSLYLLPISLSDLRQKIFIEESILIVVRLPAPIFAGERVIHILRPRVDDALAARIGLEDNVRAGESLQRALTESANYQTGNRDVRRD